MRYIALIEPTDKGFTAYSPDLPVCSVQSLTEEKAKEELREALKRYVDKLKEVGLEIPSGCCKTVVLKLSE
jgi:predicted RNase H-like HicB family nuclease